MAKMILYVTTSIDFYIARPDGAIDWLFSEADTGYDDFMKNVTTTIMGNKTYQEVLGFGVEFPYKGLDNYVISRSQSGSDNNVKFVNENIVEFFTKIKAESKGDIFLIGGGELNTIMLNAGLIDEMLIFVHPLILGEGLPLFATGANEIHFKLKEVFAYHDGLAKLHYVKK